MWICFESDLYRIDILTFLSCLVIICTQSSLRRNVATRSLAWQSHLLRRLGLQSQCIKTLHGHGEGESDHFACVLPLFILASIACTADPQVLLGKHRMTIRSGDHSVSLFRWFSFAFSCKDDLAARTTWWSQKIDPRTVWSIPHVSSDTVVYLKGLLLLCHVISFLSVPSLKLYR